MNGRSRYILRRITQSIFILWAVSVITFTVIYLAPGDTFTIVENPDISSDTINRLRESKGLSDSILVQYFRWASSVLRGDLGRSFVDSRPVVDKISERLPATLQLGIAARILGLLGIPLGIYAAVRRGSWVDNFLKIFMAVTSATPHWWMGLLILIFIAAPTGLLPLGGMFTIGKQYSIVDRVWHLVLPATISALGDWIVWMRYLRVHTLDILHQDYIRMAYAKGASRRRVLIQHVFPNALIPIVTVFGDFFAVVISGSIILETVFSWPGIGRLAFTAATQRDYPVIMALLMFTSLLILIGNLLADILYTLVEPRIELT